MLKLVPLLGRHLNDWKVATSRKLEKSMILTEIWRSLKKKSSHFTLYTTWQAICRLLGYLFSTKKSELKLGDLGTVTVPETKEGGQPRYGIGASKHAMNQKLACRSKQFGDGSKPLYPFCSPQVIAGLKWMFIPLKMDDYRYWPIPIFADLTQRNGCCFSFIRPPYFRIRVNKYLIRWRRWAHKAVASLEKP